MDILVIGLWLAVVAIAGLTVAKSMLLHRKRSAQAELRRRRQNEPIIVAESENKDRSN